MYFASAILLTILLTNPSFGEPNIDDLQVEIPQGILKGRLQLDHNNQGFYSFEAIPYAKPPIGDLRFKAPQPPEKWNGILDAAKPPKACIQMNLPSVLQMSEDCLYLNIYTSKIRNESRPVMVWIHGGGFLYGVANPQFYGPQFLVREDIVLVEIQYRLNVFGFFSLNDTSLDLSENAGLKDMVMALKWVQENIKAFGGNKDRVTIFGESAGGAAVQLLYVSPLAQGLFHGAIAQSGGVSLPWLNGPKNRLFTFAERVGCKSDKSDEIVKCLRGKSETALLEGHTFVQQKAQKLTGEFSATNIVTIEDTLVDGPFLYEDPDTTIKAGTFNKIPFMTGFCTHEGASFLKDNQVKPDFFNNEDIIPVDIRNVIQMDTRQSREIGKMIQSFYYGNETPSDSLRLEFVDYLTDIMFVEKMYRNAKKIADYAPVYFYHFDYSLQALNPDPEKLVRHAAELKYLFYRPGKTPTNIEKGSDEYTAIYRMVKMWTQFAKTGNPNIKNDELVDVNWEPFNPKEENYLYINKDLQMKQNVLPKRMQFWEGLYSTLGLLK